VRLLKENKGIFDTTFIAVEVILSAGTNAALLIGCPVQDLHWQSFTRDSQETFKTFVARAYLPQKVV